MKKLIMCAIAVLLLVGCSKEQDVAPQETDDEIIYDAHADHHVAETRRAENFFVEEVQNESTEYFLSYREPDGCETQVYNLHHGYMKPVLFSQKSAFYYINHTEGYQTQVSDGLLHRVDFSGEHTFLEVPEGVELNYIVRVDESYVYCAVNDSKEYLRTDLTLGEWVKISKEEAIA